MPENRRRHPPSGDGAPWNSEEPDSARLVWFRRRAAPRQLPPCRPASARETARRDAVWRGAAAIDAGGSTGMPGCKLVGLHGNQPTSSSHRPRSSYSTYRGRRKRVAGGKSGREKERTEGGFRCGEPGSEKDRRREQEGGRRAKESFAGDEIEGRGTKRQDGGKGKGRDGMRQTDENVWQKQKRNSRERERETKRANRQKEDDLCKGIKKMVREGEGWLRRDYPFPRLPSSTPRVHVHRKSRHLTSSLVGHSRAD